MNLKTVFLASKWDAHWAKVAEAMPEAVSNTVIGVLVVFCALLFFSFVISLLKYVNAAENKKAAKKEAKAEAKALPMTAIENTVAQIEEEELCNDAELVAVITAAIYEYEAAAAAQAQAQGLPVPARTNQNGLVVRSIRRARCNW
ncbi:MAG: OadG family protein [Lachnospiraceae bacterium]|nr:OadG family protein [Lachnospiraceae bacterium]